MIMKKSTYTPMVIVVIFLVGTILFFYSKHVGSERKNTSAHTSEAAPTIFIKESNSNGVTDTKKVNMKEQSKIIKNAHKTKHRTQFSSSDFDGIHTGPDAVPFTLEEEKYLNTLFEKTEMLYREIAPEIFDEILNEEIEDPNWKSTVESKINSILEDDNFQDSFLESVDCRERLCKLQLYLSGVESRDYFKRQFMNNGPESGELHATYSKLENGGFKSRIYFTRESIISPFIDARKRILERLTD